jgi:hypothetical protein
VVCNEENAYGGSNGRAKQLDLCNLICVISSMGSCHRCGDVDETFERHRFYFKKNIMLLQKKIKNYEHTKIT